MAASSIRRRSCAFVLVVILVLMYLAPLSSWPKLRWGFHLNSSSFNTIGAAYESESTNVFDAGPTTSVVNLAKHQSPQKKTAKQNALATQTDQPVVISEEPSANTNEERLQRIKDFCSNFPKPPEDIYSHMRRWTFRWMLAHDGDKTLYCTISKASSSTLKYLLMKVRDPNVSEIHIRAHNREILREHGFVFLHEYPNKEAEFRLQNYYKYMVVRDPFDRLVSAHRDKFLQKDEPWYRDILGPKIKNMYRPKDVSTKKDVEFWEFVKFIANGEDPLRFDRHWVPQFYVCDPCNVHYDYIAKVETMERDAKVIFEHMGLPWIGFPLKNSHGMDDENRSLSEVYAAIESEDQDKLSEIYTNDMHAFGYSEPWSM